MWSVSTSRARDTAQNALKCPLVAFLRLVGIKGRGPRQNAVGGAPAPFMQQQQFHILFFCSPAPVGEFFCSAVLQRGIRVHPNKRANITRSVYIFPLLAIYDFLEKRQRKRDVRRVSFRFLLAVRKTAPHFRFCLSVFRLERHAVGKLCRFLSSSETVLCAMLE